MVIKNVSFPPENLSLDRLNFWGDAEKFELFDLFNAK